MNRKIKGQGWTRVFQFFAFFDDTLLQALYVCACFILRFSGKVGEEEEEEMMEDDAEAEAEA